MQKVLIYRSKLLPYSETFIKAQAEALKSWEYMLLGKKLSNRSRILIEKSKYKLIPSSSNNRFVSKLFGFFYNRRFNQFVEELKRENFSLLHVHFGTDAVNIAYLADLLHIPMLVTLHGFDITTYKEVWESGARGQRKKQYPQKLVELARRPNVNFIAVSENIKECAVAYGIPEEKVKVVYIGVDTNQFYPAGLPILQRKKRILYVGRMVEKKGGSILINAYAKVLQTIPDVELMMIGEGDLLDSFREQASLLNVPVEFVGTKTSQEVKALLDTSRVFCLPSVTAKSGDAEGMGMVVLEAQACGVPAITSARGSVKEGLIDGRTGLSFDEHDVDSLVKHLVRVLSDDVLVEAMSQQAVSFMKERFDISACTKKLEAYYAQCATNH